MLYFKNRRNKKCKATILKNSGVSLHLPFILVISGNVQHSWNGAIMNLGRFKVALHNVKKPLHTRGVVLGHCLQTLFCKEQCDTGEQKHSIEILGAGVCSCIWLGWSVQWAPWHIPLCLSWISPWTGLKGSWKQALAEMFMDNGQEIVNWNYCLLNPINEYEILH